MSKIIGKHICSPKICVFTVALAYQTQSRSEWTNKWALSTSARYELHTHTHIFRLNRNYGIPINASLFILKWNNERRKRQGGWKAYTYFHIFGWSLVFCLLNWLYTLNGGLFSLFFFWFSTLHLCCSPSLALPPMAFCAPRQAQQQNRAQHHYQR